MVPLEHIQQYGHKAANLMYAKANLPEMPILPFTVKRPSDSIDTVLADFKSMKKPVIVRSSPRQDYDGVFESVSGVQTDYEFRSAVNRVQESAKSSRAISHALFRGKEPDLEMPLIIQEQSDSRFNGMMMEFPNHPDKLYLCQYPVQSGRHKGLNQSLFWDMELKTPVENYALPNNRVSEPEGNSHANQYREIHTLWSNQSVIVEYGVSPFSLFEVKTFKPLESANFEVPKAGVDWRVGMNADAVIGITPPQGIVLPILRSIGYDDIPFIRQSEMNTMGFHREDKDLHEALLEIGEYGHASPQSKEYWKEFVGLRNKLLAKKIGEPYLFATTSLRSEMGNMGFDMDLTLPNLHAIATSSLDNFLTHGCIRLFRGASVVLGIHLFEQRECLFGRLESNSGKVRIISNGKEAGIMKE